MRMNPTQEGLLPEDESFGWNCILEAMAERSRSGRKVRFLVFWKVPVLDVGLAEEVESD